MAFILSELRISFTPVTTVYVLREAIMITGGIFMEKDKSEKRKLGKYLTDAVLEV